METMEDRGNGKNVAAGNEDRGIEYACELLNSIKPFSEKYTPGSQQMMDEILELFRTIDVISDIVGRELNKLSQMVGGKGLD